MHNRWKCLVVGDTGAMVIATSDESSLVLLEGAILDS